MIVLVPSRGRPRNIRALCEAWKQTRANAFLYVIIDEDEPERQLYELAVKPFEEHVYLMAVPAGLGPGMVGALNYFAVAASRISNVGFMGDDHRPRVIGWDRRISEELERLRTGIVYPNDLFQGERLPTSVFMTGDIVSTLGWMAPPCLSHLFVDDAWKALGEALGSMTYLPEVVIEHLHPHAGKADLDPGYERVNASAIWTHDEQAFHAWRDQELPECVRKIREHASAVVR